MTQVLDEEIVVLSEEKDEPKQTHLVHDACNLSVVPLPPFVTSMCGIALDWEERKQDSTQQQDCSICAVEKFCPKCNVRVRA